MIGITLYDPANWTEQSMDVFSYCFDIVARGCDSSTTLERELRRKFWWMTPNNSYTYVWVWFRNKEMLCGLLNNWRVEDPENSSNASTRTLSSDSTFTDSPSNASGAPCATTP